MGGYLYQFWTFGGKHRHGFRLNPGEGDDFAVCAAGFREWIEGWRYVYDLKAGTFSAPADFAEHNAEAVKCSGGPSE